MPAGGKSALCMKLSRAYDLPFFPIDKIQRNVQNEQENFRMEVKMGDLRNLAHRFLI